MEKSQVIAALSAFARQRSGIEYGNYGDVAAFRSEQRSITRDLAHVRVLLSAVSWRDSITGDMIAEAAKHAYSGRLTITERDGGIVVDYCAGQYFPTEYRRAVCAVLASVLWNNLRDSCMPQAFSGERTPATSPGSYMRSTFRKEFGRGIANRWFN